MIQKQKIILLVLLSLVLGACSLTTIEKSSRNPANTGIDALFGPEFSFTNSKILNSMTGATDYANKLNIDILREWKAKFELLCVVLACKVVKTSDKHGEAYRIKFEDGFWLQAGTDTGCLEVQAKPSTVSEFTERKDIIKRMIWESGAELDLKPHVRIGGGHVNVDLKTAFPNNDALLFRNFVVDQANNPHLVAGIFGNHTGNSPPISALEPHLHDSFKDTIRIFDETLDATGGLAAMQHLGKEIDRRVYVSNPFWLNNKKKVWTPSYYQHLSFRSIGQSVAEEQRRIELRGFRPQQTINEFILEAEFINGRLTYLRDINRPIEVKIPKRINFSRQEKISRFTELVKESRLDEARFKYFADYPFENQAFIVDSPRVDTPTPSPEARFRSGINPMNQCLSVFRTVR